MSKQSKLKEEKRQKRFEKRREEGKAYVYEKNPFDKNSENKKEVRKYWKERNARARKNVDHRLPLAKETSRMRKLQNLEAARKEEARKAEMLKTIQNEVMSDALRD